LFAAARAQLAEELDIITVIKKIRYLDAFYQHLRLSGDYNFDFDQNWKREVTLIDNSELLPRSQPQDPKLK